MNRTSQSIGLGRRGFLAWLSASLPLVVAGCQDEPIVVSRPTDAPPEAMAYREVLLEYFGKDVLSDAAFIGGYYATLAELDAAAAYASTLATRELVDQNQPRAALAALEARLGNDFLKLSIVDLAGWTLSRTEVELCLLAWLT